MNKLRRNRFEMIAQATLEELPNTILGGIYHPAKNHSGYVEYLFATKLEASMISQKLLKLETISNYVDQLEDGTWRVRAYAKEAK